MALTITHIFQSKKLSALRMISAIILSLLPSLLSAQTPVDENYVDEYNITYTLYDNNTAVVTNGRSARVDENSGETRIASPINYGGTAYAVTEIKDKAFQTFFSTNIEAIRMNDGIKIIGKYAFQNQSKLKKIYLPSTLETIEGTAFDGCTALTDIFCSSYTVPTIPDNQFSGIDMREITLHISEGYKDIYAAEGSPFAGATIIETKSSDLYTKRPELIIDKNELDFTSGETKDLKITFDNSIHYKVLQFNLTLPEGIHINTKEGGYNIQTQTANAGGSGQRTCTTSVESDTDGSYKILTYSTSGNFLGETVLILNISVNESFRGGKIVFSHMSAGTEVNPGNNENPITQGMVEAIEKIYTLDGPEMPEVPAESVTISAPEKTELAVGATLALTATVAPDNTTDKTVIWSSSDDGIATVSAYGVVKALKSGIVEITAACGAASAKVSVTVFMYGDVNDDGKITEEDVKLTVDYILQRNPEKFLTKRADINGDDLIDIFDMTNILELLLKQQ